MTRDEVKRRALAVLRKVLRLEETDQTLGDEVTFGELDVWPADLLDLDFELAREFGRRLSNDHEAVKLKRARPPYDWITVGDYVAWVYGRTSAQPMAA